MRVNVKMLSSTDSNKKLKTWSQELGPFTIASVITGHSLLDDQLSRDINKALGPGQGGVDVAFSIGFYCDLGADAQLHGESRGENHALCRSDASVLLAWKNV